mgnify:CR=1 FL=1
MIQILIKNKKIIGITTTLTITDIIIIFLYLENSLYKINFNKELKNIVLHSLYLK